MLASWSYGLCHAVAFTSDAKAFEGDPARTPHYTWWWWLMLAAILLPLDIALRRLGA